MPIDWRWNLEISWLHRHVWFMQTCQIHPNPTNEWTPVVRLSLTPYPTLFQQAVKLSQAAVRLMEGLASGLRVRPLRSPAPPWLGLNQGFVARVTGGYVDTTKIKITKVGFLLFTIITFHSPKLAGSAIVPFLQLELRSKLVRSGCHISGCLPQLAVGHQIRVV